MVGDGEWVLVDTEAGGALRAGSAGRR
jgi:hypothetical protein